MNKIKRQNNSFAKRNKVAKKSILVAIVVGIMAVVGSVGCFAASGNVDTSSFVTSAMTVLKSVICLIGAGVGIWGIVNLIEGYGNDNPGAKSQGIKQFVAGFGLIILGLVMVPILQTMFTNAM